MGFTINIEGLFKTLRTRIIKCQFAKFVFLKHKAKLDGGFSMYRKLFVVGLYCLMALFLMLHAVDGITRKMLIRK